MKQDAQAAKSRGIQIGSRIFFLFYHADGHGAQGQCLKQDHADRDDHHDEQGDKPLHGHKIKQDIIIRQRGMISRRSDVMVDQPVDQRMNREDHQQTVDDFETQSVSDPDQTPSQTRSFFAVFCFDIFR